MDISEQLRCLFSANVKERDGSYQIEVPNQEIHRGNIDPDDTYRVAIISSPANGESEVIDTNGENEGIVTNGENEVIDTNGENEGMDTESQREQGTLGPPVEEGDTRDVEIKDIGEQGDGITRVERGFVVIVPDTEESERVTIEITDVQENVAFAKVIDRLSYEE